MRLHIQWANGNFSQELALYSSREKLKSLDNTDTDRAWHKCYDPN